MSGAVAAAGVFDAGGGPPPPGSTREFMVVGADGDIVYVSEFDGAREYMTAAVAYVEEA